MLLVFDSQFFPLSVLTEPHLQQTHPNLQDSGRIKESQLAHPPSFLNTPGMSQGARGATSMGLQARKRHWRCLEIQESHPWISQQQKGKEDSCTCQDGNYWERGEGFHSPNPKSMAGVGDPLLLSIPCSFPGNENQRWERCPLNSR